MSNKSNLDKVAQNYDAAEAEKKASQERRRGPRAPMYDSGGSRALDALGAPQRALKEAAINKQQAGQLVATGMLGETMSNQDKDNR